jgi:hypothetical protein
VLVGVGCQSASSPASTDSDAAAGTATMAAHRRPVVVREFRFEAAQVHTEQGLLAGREGPARRVVGTLRSEETPAQKAARLAGLLSESIAKELTALKIPAIHETGVTQLPTNGIVVGGQFMEVDEGNRLRRALVGFGSGSTEVLVQVAVYDLLQSRDQPVLIYGTGKGSKPMPGAVVFLNPYAMAAKYVMSCTATEKDVRALGKQIARDLAQIESGKIPKR